jgi:hypothetical protein
LPKWTPEAGSFGFVIPDMKKMASERGQEVPSPERPSFWKALVKRF